MERESGGIKGKRAERLPQSMGKKKVQSFLHSSVEILYFFCWDGNHRKLDVCYHRKPHEILAQR